MGRHRDHAMKFPEHLYLSPPQSPTTPGSSSSASSSASSFLSFNSATYSSPITLISETSSTALAVRDRIPGFKTSAAFLNSLRANLTLADGYSTPTSLTSTPDSLRPVNMASSTSSLPPPSPSPLAQPSDFPETAEAPSAPADPLADIPALTTSLATTTDDKIEGLRLVADSIAQQRQVASNAVIYHPISVAVALGLFAIAGQYLYKGERSDWALVGTTFVGLLMGALVSVRWAVSGYIEEAERVGTWKWLNQGREAETSSGGKEKDIAVAGKEDSILLTRYGEDVVGALILRGVRDPSSSSTSTTSTEKKRRSTSAPTGVIRAWTVLRRYRGKGLGTLLLEEAVKICRENGWTGPTFAPDHANSVRFLWPMFNGGIDKREAKGRLLLEKVIAEADGTSTNTRTSKAGTTGGKKKR